MNEILSNLIGVMVHNRSREIKGVVRAIYYDHKFGGLNFLLETVNGLRLMGIDGDTIEICK
jgi:hypothetical protein